MTDKEKGKQFAQDILDMAQARNLSPEVAVAVFAGLIGTVAVLCVNPPQVVQDAMKNINSAAVR